MRQGLIGSWPVRAGVVLAALSAVAGCGHHHHDDDDRPPLREEVVVEQPPREEVVVERPAEVEYVAPPREVVVVYERDLSPYGHWVQTRYGRCWVCEGRRPGWRPYTVGHWVATSDGWLWVSEEDEAAWGPTCYHYGRWYEDEQYGWVWVPGRVWAPSWCAWREGGEYSAWAPLPPECGDGYPCDAVVVNRYVHEDRYNVVETRNITNVHVQQTIIQNNVTIVNQTTNVTNVTYVNGRAVNRGVDIHRVERAVGHRVDVAPVEKVSSPAEARQRVAEGRPVRYVPPAIETYTRSHPVVARQVNHAAVENAEHKNTGRGERTPPVNDPSRGYPSGDNAKPLREPRPLDRNNPPTVHDDRLVEPDRPVVRDPRSIEPRDPAIHQDRVIERDRPVVRDPRSIEPRDPAIHQDRVIERDRPVVREPRPIERDNPRDERSEHVVPGSTDNAEHKNINRGEKVQPEQNGPRDPRDPKKLKPGEHPNDRTDPVR